MAYIFGFGLYAPIPRVNLTYNHVRGKKCEIEVPNYGGNVYIVLFNLKGIVSLFDTKMQKI